MKKFMRLAIKAMMVIVTVYAVKVAVVDLWECYLAVDMVEAAKTALKAMI